MLYLDLKDFKQSNPTGGKEKTKVSARVCLQRQEGYLEHILEITEKSDYLTYKLEALWNDQAQIEVNVHQMRSNLLKTCRSY